MDFKNFKISLNWGVEFLLFSFICIPVFDLLFFYSISIGNEISGTIIFSFILS